MTAATNVVTFPQVTPDAREMNPQEPWADEIDAWARHLRSAGRPSTTIRTRRDHLRMLARQSGRRTPWDLTLDDLVDWTGAQPWGAETRRSVRSSLRGFYGWAVTTRRITDDPTEGLPTIRRTKPRPKPTPEPGLEESLAKAEPRELLMILLAADAGLRRGEISRVHTRDVFPDLDGWSLRVRGKGDKIREVPLTDQLAALLRALPPGYAFPGNDHGHLSAGWVGTLITRLLPPGYTTHSLRHRFATVGYDRTHDLLAMQDLLGHADPNTTRCYIKVSNTRARAVVVAIAGGAETPATEDAIAA